MFRIFLALFLMSASLKANDKLSENTTFHLLQKIFSLDWKVSGTYQLANGQFELPENSIALQGKDAHQFMKFSSDWDGIDPPPCYNCLDMIISDYDFEKLTFFESCNLGYTPLSEWENLDSDNLLEQVWQCIETRNELQKNEKILKISLAKWIEKPTLDEDTHTIHWILEMIDEGGNSFINTTVIKLHRFGYIKITDSVEKKLYDPLNEDFNLIVRSYNINSGSRYLDFSEEDEMVTLDIRALAGL